MPIRSRGWCAPTSRGPAHKRPSTHWDGKLLKILNATSTTAGPASPGQVVGLHDGGIGIGTGDGVLAVDKLQMEGFLANGRRPSNAQDFVRGYPAFVGSELGPLPTPEPST